MSFLPFEDNIFRDVLDKYQKGNQDSSIEVSENSSSLKEMFIDFLVSVKRAVLSKISSITVPSVVFFLQTRAPTVILVPIFFFMNGLFNVITMVILINFSMRTDIRWMQITFPIGYVLSYLIIGFYCALYFVKIGKIKDSWGYKLAMIWGNLFVFTVHFVEKIEGEKKKNEEERTSIITAAKLQIVHYFANLVAVCVCVHLRPEDYIFVPDWIIRLYIVFSFLSIVSCLVAWLFRVLYQYPAFNLWFDNLLYQDPVPEPEHFSQDEIGQVFNHETDNAAASMTIAPVVPNWREQTLDQESHSSYEEDVVVQNQQSLPIEILLVPEESLNLRESTDAKVKISFRTDVEVHRLKSTRRERSPSHSSSKTSGDAGSRARRTHSSRKAAAVSHVEGQVTTSKRKKKKKHDPETVDSVPDLESLV